MLYRLCTICNKRVEYGKQCKCEVDREKERYKEYNKYTRKNKDMQITGSKEWIRLRDYIRAKQCNMCLYSYYVLNEIIVGTICHHIEPKEEVKERTYDSTNLIMLSDSVHRYTVHKAYNKSAKDKRDMQELLFSLLKRWEEEFGG